MIWSPFFFHTRNLRLLYCWKLSWEWSRYEEFRDGEFEIGDSRDEYVQWNSSLGGFHVRIDYLTGLRYHVYMEDDESCGRNFVGSFWTMRGVRRWLQATHSLHKMRVIHNH